MFKTPEETTNVTENVVSSCTSEAPKLEVGQFKPFQVEVWSSTNWLGKHRHDGEGRRSPRSRPKPHDTSVEARQSFPKRSIKGLNGLVHVCLHVVHPSHESVFRSKSVLLPVTSLKNFVSRWSCCWRRRGLGFHLFLSFQGLSGVE